MRPEKLFRVDEANAIVPRLQLLMERLQRSALRLHDEMTALAQEQGVELAAVSSDELLLRRPDARALVEELDGIVREWKNQAGDKIRAEFQEALEANKKAGG